MKHSNLYKICWSDINGKPWEVVVKCDPEHPNIQARALKMCRRHEAQTGVANKISSMIIGFGNDWKFVL